MAKFNYTQTTFAGGKLSPLMKGRVDVKEYFQGCEELKNFENIPTGGVHRRKGLDHASAAYFASAATYVMYPYNNIGSSTPIAIKVYKSDSTHLTFEAINLSTGATLYGGASSFAGTSAITVDLRYVQIGRLVIFTHYSGGLEPIVFNPSPIVGVYQFDTWSVVGSRTTKQPFKSPNASVVTLTPASTVTGSSIVVTASSAIFSSSWVGKSIRITHGSVESIGTVSAYTDTTHIYAVFYVACGAVTATTNWRVSAWLDSFPIDVTFFEGRLVFLHADGVQASYRGNLYHLNQIPLIQDISSDASGINFFGLIADNNQFPFTFEEGSIDAGVNSWIAGSDMLYVGTTNTVTAYTGGDTSISVDAKRMLYLNASSAYDIKPSVFNDSIVFPSSDKKSLNMLSKTGEGIQLIDLFATNKEVLDGYIIYRMAYLSKNRQLYILLRDEITNSNEKLISISLNSENSMYALKDIEIADTDLVIEPKSVFTITSGLLEQLWVIAQSLQDLTLNGYYHLYYSPFVNNKGNGDTPILDFRETKSNAGSLFPVAYYPNGTEIIAWDYTGNRKFTKTVQSGVIDLSGETNPPTTVIIGFPFESKLKTMPIEAGAEEGTSQGEIKRIDRCDVLVYQSKGFKIGSSDTRYETDRSATFFSGRKKIYFPSDPDLDQQVQIVSDDIYHCTILNITAKGQTNV